MPWDIVFYKAANESVPTDDFLDACPVKVRAQLLAVLDAVAGAVRAAAGNPLLWQPFGRQKRPRAGVERQARRGGFLRRVLLRLGDAVLPGTSGLRAEWTGSGRPDAEPA